MDKDNGDGGYAVAYVTSNDCAAKSGQIIGLIRENRNTIYGVPGERGGMMTSLTELWSEWNTFKGLMKFLMSTSFLINLLTLLRMFNII